jgi:hypothetical protein
MNHQGRPHGRDAERGANQPDAQVFWRVLDALDYWLTLTRLRIQDALCGEGIEITTDE